MGQTARAFAGVLAATAALCACSHQDAPGVRAPGSAAAQLQDARSAYLRGDISKQQYERERSDITRH